MWPLQVIRCVCRSQAMAFVRPSGQARRGQFQQGQLGLSESAQATHFGTEFLCYAHVLNRSVLLRSWVPPPLAGRARQGAEPVWECFRLSRSFRAR